MATAIRASTSATRIRQVVMTSRAVHLMAVRMDATPKQADYFAHLAAMLMRAPVSGAKAYAICERLAHRELVIKSNESKLVA